MKMNVAGISVTPNPGVLNVRGDVPPVSVHSLKMARCMRLYVEDAMLSDASSITKNYRKFIIKLTLDRGVHGEMAPFITTSTCSTMVQRFTPCRL